ncbi:MAG: DNA polymerase III subunit chi [Burkholderiales bacterium]|nr:DNA polymerase III subunit chi [Burkholderiales bacterium]
MTSIDFYIQVDDKLDLARKLCAKALANKARMVLWLADRAGCQNLSRLIWSQPSTGFIPHCANADPLAAVTPIIIDCDSGPFPHDHVLVNLRTEIPPFFSRFERMIEIVSAIDDDDKRAARERYRHYRDRGYELRTHDLARLANAGMH